MHGRNDFAQIPSWVHSDPGGLVAEPGLFREAGCSVVRVKGRIIGKDSQIYRNPAPPRIFDEFLEVCC
jgi:hypothetical protein